jgi:hypothetical protein
MKIPNKYKCQKALWNKMSDRGQLAYNNLRAWKQTEILPVGTELSDKEWDVISNNFACVAAWEFNIK